MSKFQEMKAKAIAKAAEVAVKAQESVETGEGRSFSSPVTLTPEAKAKLGDVKASTLNRVNAARNNVAAHLATKEEADE